METSINPRFNLSSPSSGPTRRLLTSFQLFKQKTSNTSQTRAELTDIRHASPVSVQGTVVYVPTRTAVTPCLTLTQCQVVMSALLKKDSDGFFHYPVDAEALGLFDYHEIIKIPMDFATISNKLTTGKYNRVADTTSSLVNASFFQDLNQIFTNAYAYNKPNTPVSSLATVLEDEANRLIASLHKEYQPSQECQHITRITTMAGVILNELGSSTTQGSVSPYQHILMKLKKGDYANQSGDFNTKTYSQDVEQIQDTMRSSRSSGSSSSSSSSSSNKESQDPSSSSSLSPPPSTTIYNERQDFLAKFNWLKYSSGLTNENEDDEDDNTLGSTSLSTSINIIEVEDYYYELLNGRSYLWLISKNSNILYCISTTEPRPLQYLPEPLPAYGRVFKGGLFIFHFVHVICEALSEWSKNSTNGGWSDQQEPAIIHHSLRISKLLNFRINDKELKTYVEKCSKLRSQVFWNTSPIIDCTYCYNTFFL